MTEKEVIHKKERFTFPRCRLFRLRCWLHLRHSAGGRRSEGFPPRSGGLVASRSGGRFRFLNAE
jgi:hypothetical protein